MQTHLVFGHTKRVCIYNMHFSLYFFVILLKCANFAMFIHKKTQNISVQT